MNTVTGRVGAAFIMIVLLAWGYWWLTLIAAVIFLFVYDSYYEIVLVGICFDALYASPQQGALDYHTHLATIAAIVLLFASIFLKKRLAFYS